MIDHEKLKLAHELALSLEHPYYVDFIINREHSEYTINDCESSLKTMTSFITESIDDLIAKLQELTLTQTKPKYEVGQSVEITMNDFTKKELDFWHPYSPQPRCDMCKSDGVECYHPDNKERYTGLCKDCFHVFYENNKLLFEIDK